MLNITGKRFTRLFPLNNNIVKFVESSDIKTWINKVYLSNTEIIISKANYNSTKKSVGVEWGKHLPSIELVAKYADSNQDGGSIGGRKQDEKSVLLQLTVPIWSGGETQGRVNREIAIQNIAYEDYMQVIKRLNIETSTTLSILVASKMKIEAFKNSLKSAKLVISAFKEGVVSGTNTQLELMEVKLEELKVKKDLIEANNDLILAKVQLLKLSGQLNRSIIN